MPVLPDGTTNATGGPSRSKAARTRAPLAGLLCATMLVTVTIAYPAGAISSSPSAWSAAGHMAIARAFHTATLGPLVAYERTHPGSALSSTLAAFLAADRNVAQTARALYAHYNTTRQRLERLEHLLGPFVGDARRCLELELALQAGRLLGSRHLRIDDAP